MVFPVGEDDEHPRFVLFCLKGLARLVDRIGNGRSLHLHPISVHDVKKHLCGAVIERKRALYETLPRKNDKPDPVALEQIDKTVYLEFRPFDAAGGDIFGEHTL